MRPSARRLAPTLLAALIGSATWIVAAGMPVLAQSSETFRDEFDTISFGGDDGTSDFAGSWRELGESDGAAGGVVRVLADVRCWGGTGQCLRIGADNGSLDPYAVERTADLTGSQAATLRFAWRRKSQGSATGSVVVRISGNGGASWSTLLTIPIAGSQSTKSATVDITAWSGASTTVRFDGFGSAVNGYLHIDNVEIASSTGTPVTTTTSPPAPTSTTTTTTTGPTTTTSTTTTSPPGATTTTTTSAEGATTTTTIGSGTATSTSPTTTSNAATSTTSAGENPPPPPTYQNPGPRPTDTEGQTPAPVTTPPDADASEHPTHAPAEDDGTATPQAMGEGGDSTQEAAGDVPVALLIGAQLLGLGSLVGILAGVGVGGRTGRR